jgi:lambda family phage tail tape measure protein
MATERFDIVFSTRGTREVRREIAGIGSGSASAASSVDFLRNSLIAIGSAQIIRGLVSIADTYQNVQNRLRQVTSGTDELRVVTEELFDIANKTRVGFEETSQLYFRSARAAQTLGKSQREVLDFTTALSQSVALSGASVREANLAVLQFTQGLAANRLAGDELRSVLEQLPNIAASIAKQLGVTIGELKDLASTGAVTSETIFAAFSGEEAARIASEFERTIPTVEQSLVVLKNRVIELVGEFNQATGATQKLSAVIKLLGDNADVIARAVLGGIFALSVIKAVQAIQLLTVVIAANPLGFLLTALTAGVVALIAFSDRIVSLQDGLTTLQDFFQAFAEFLGSRFTELLDLISGFFGELPDLASVSFEDVLIGGAQFLDNFLGVFLGTFYAIGALLSNVGENWPELITFAVKQMVNAAIKALNFLPKAINALIDGLIASFSSFFKRLELAWIYWSQAVNNAFDGNFDAALENIKDATFQVENAVVNIGDNVRRAYNKYKDINLIPTLKISGAEQAAAEQLGQDVIDAFLKGFNEPGAAEANIQSILARAREIASERASAAQAQAARDVAAREGLNAPGADLTGEIRARVLKEITDGLTREASLLSLGNREREVRNALDKIQEDLRAKKVTATPDELSAFQRQVEFNFALKDQARVLEEIKGPQDEIKNNIAAINALYSQGKITIDEYSEALRNQRIAQLESDRSVAGGFERGFLKLQNQIGDFAAQAESTLVNAFSSAEDALVEFVQSGQFNFSKLVDSILADLTRLLARQALFSLIGAFAGPAGGATVVDSSLSTLLSGSRAEGGPVSAGKSYLVGERGPEIFQPNVSGTIVPNGATMSAPQLNVSVVNVTDPDEVGSALNDPRNQEIIVNIIGRNRQAINRSLGNG